MDMSLVHEYQMPIMLVAVPLLCGVIMANTDFLCHFKIVNDLSVLRYSNFSHQSFNVSDRKTLQWFLHKTESYTY